MGMLDDDMKRLIAQAKLSFAATVDADGTPNLSPKATLMALDDDHLVFAHIASPNTVSNLARNPAIEVNVVDIFLRRGYRFKGTAELVESGPAYDFVSARVRAKHGDAYPIHAAVVVRVERARALLSPAYIFGEDVDEADLRETWLAEYGVRDVRREAAE